MNNIIKVGNKKLFDKKPKQRFRVIIQKKSNNNNQNEEMRSFTVYDYTNKVNVDSLKNKLLKTTRRK